MSRPDHDEHGVVTDQTTTYDELPYESKTYRGRHPDRCATIARLRGLSAPDPRRARILEIGCSTGSNLVGIALSLPDAVLVGIDPSATQIERARDLARRVGTENLTFQVSTADLFASGASESFDYILCHGVYSWVSPAGQRSIRECIGKLLAPSGVASVSFNALPGWYTRLPIRDFLLKRDDASRAMGDRVRDARAALHSLLESCAYDLDRPATMILCNELKRIAAEPDAYLFHEFLERENHSWYVADFANDMAAHGLQLLGDARFQRMSLNRLLGGDVPSAAFKHVLKLSQDQIGVEETMDLLYHNPFREALLCRSEVALDTEFDTTVLRDLSYSGYLKCDDLEYELDDREIELRDFKGAILRTSSPLVKSAIRVLSEVWPQYVSFQELFADARRPLRGARASSEEDSRLSQQLLGGILEWLQRDLIEASTFPPKCGWRVTSKPRASALARVQATGGPRVTNLFHSTVEVGELEAAILPLLDGSHDREALKGAALSLIERGAGGIREDGVVVTDPKRRSELLDELIEATLDTIRRAGLLEG